ncbi:MAG: VOC family protein [Chloroflexi bacterium]|nr:VOC family protein [Chloroflexota bacterium]
MVVNVERPPAPQAHNRFEVGGVLLDRPFRIRRLGHFGVNVDRIDEGLHFYSDLLGFMISDEINFGARLTDEQRAALGPNASTTGYFTRFGTDHHAFVLFPRKIMGPAENNPITINQITWQVGSLAEVVAGSRFFEDQGIAVRRSGRDTPGSNWHTYPLDPDGHVNELYYGIEQVGWEGYSKPRTMYNRGFRERPPLPQISELDEVDAALSEGVDLESGFRASEKNPRTFDVDGILLARPFKIVRIGPVRIFVDDVQRSRAFYESVLGLSVSQTLTWNGHECVFMRVNTEHHSLALYPAALRERLGLSPHTTLMSFGVQLANYRQLRDAVGFLRERGVQVRELPPELSPGIDYSCLAIDPEGHAVQLYYYMQQLPPPTAPLSAPGAERIDAWPVTVDARPDTFLGEPYLGPWG